MHQEFSSVLNITSCERNLRSERFTLLLSGLTVTFLKEFGVGIWLTLPVVLSLAVFIVALGQVAGACESWKRFDSFYWSFITATTVGYGDLRPTKTASKLLAIIIGLLGLTFTGILIAIAVHAGTFALEAHDAAGRLK